jgi:hypothetical protein
MMMAAPRSFSPSPWGIGFRKLAGGALTSTSMAANGMTIGAWTLNTAANQSGPAGDFDAGRAVGLLVFDAHGVGLLKLAGAA